MHTMYVYHYEFTCMSKDQFMMKNRCSMHDSHIKEELSYTIRKKAIVTNNVLINLLIIKYNFQYIYNTYIDYIKHQKHCNTSKNRIYNINLIHTLQIYYKNNFLKNSTKNDLYYTVIKTF